MQIWVDLFRVQPIGVQQVVFVPPTYDLLKKGTVPYLPGNTLTWFLKIICHEKTTTEILKQFLLAHCLFPLKAILSSYMPNSFYYLTPTEPFFPQCGNNVLTFPTSIFLLSLFSSLCSFHFFFCFLLINFAKKQNSPCRCRWYRSARWTPPIWSCPRRMAGSRAAGSSSGLGGGGVWFESQKRG